MGDASAFVDLLASLRQGGPEFAGWWKARKLMKHPKRGLLRFGHASFKPTTIRR